MAGGLKELILNAEILTYYIDKFWNDIFTSIKDNKHLMLLCKVEFNNSEMGYRTIGDLRRVNYEDKEQFIEYLIQRLGILNDSYTSLPISNITFTYFIKDGLASDQDRRLLQDLSDKSTFTHRFNNMNLPITMKPEEYGNVLVDNFVQIDGQSIHRFMVESGTRTYTIDVSKDGLTNKVKIQGAVDLQWIDTKISDEVFRREIGKSIIFFMGGERILRKKQLNAKPFNRVSTDNQLNSNFITMDIETVKLDNKITPYLICAYNGIDYITSYANESLDQKSLFNSFIMGLLSFFKANSNSITVYAHNLSGFDGILLMKHCLSFGQVDPLLHNGKLISIKLKLNIIGYKSKTIIFKDSFLLLPLSLRNLCSAFNVTTPKGYFPFKLKKSIFK